MMKKINKHNCMFQTLAIFSTIQLNLEKFNLEENRCEA